MQNNFFRKIGKFRNQYDLRIILRNTKIIVVELGCRIEEEVHRIHQGGFPRACGVLLVDPGQTRFGPIARGLALFQFPSGGVGIGPGVTRQLIRRIN